MQRDIRLLRTLVSCEPSIGSRAVRSASWRALSVPSLFLTTSSSSTRSTRLVSLMARRSGCLELYVRSCCGVDKRQRASARWDMRCSSSTRTRRGLGTTPACWTSRCESPSRIISASLNLDPANVRHMYFTDANHAFRCFHNPHCVRQEDYVKPATHAIDMPPEPERGVLPAWRIFGLNFVSLTRALAADSSGAHGQTSTTPSSSTPPSTGVSMATMAARSGRITSWGQSGRSCMFRFCSSSLIFAPSRIQDTQRSQCRSS